MVNHGYRHEQTKPGTSTGPTRIARGPGEDREKVGIASNYAPNQAKHFEAADAPNEC